MTIGREGTEGGTALVFRDNMPPVVTFELMSKRNQAKVLHCGVLEYNAPDQMAVLPEFVGLNGGGRRKGGLREGRGGYR